MNILRTKTPQEKRDEQRRKFGAQFAGGRKIIISVRQRATFLNMTEAVRKFLRLPRAEKMEMLDNLEKELEKDKSELRSMLRERSSLGKHLQELKELIEQAQIDSLSLTAKLEALCATIAALQNSIELNEQKIELFQKISKNLNSFIGDFVELRIVDIRKMVFCETMTDLTRMNYDVAQHIWFALIARGIEFHPDVPQDCDFTTRKENHDADFYKNQIAKALGITPQDKTSLMKELLQSDNENGKRDRAIIDGYDVNDEADDENVAFPQSKRAKTSSKRAKTPSKRANVSERIEDLKSSLEKLKAEESAQAKSDPVDVNNQSSEEEEEEDTKPDAC